jgi:signal transduction histidine kinase
VTEGAETRIDARRSSPPRPGFFALTERWRERPVIGYGIAVITALVALAITYQFQVQLDRVLFVVFFLAVGLTGWAGGLGPAIVAIAIAIAGVTYFILPPERSFAIAGGELIPLGAFAVVSGIISWLATSQRKLTFALADQAKVLQEQNLELEIQRADAEAANAAKAQFLASMSHELRTPLNAIAGYAELMEIGVLGPVTAKQIEALGRLQRSRKHLNGMVDQVLNFARIEAGKVEFDIKAVPVNDTLLRLAEMIAPQVAGKKLSYDFEGCDESIAVLADHDRLDQILLNLLGNAVKYTPSGGSVRLAVERDSTQVRLKVIDTGPGIPEDRQQDIFHPFVQLGTNTDGLTSGVGLGLAISRDLARGMGGEIKVESTLGTGSTFTVALPRG